MLTRSVATVVALLAIAAAVGAPGADAPPRPRGVVYPPADDTDRKLDAVLAEVRFDRTPLDQAIGALRRQAGANLVVHWPSLAAAGVPRDAPVEVALADVPLGDALDAVLFQVGGAAAEAMWETSGNVIRVGAGETVHGPGVGRVYDVGDIVLAEHERWFAMNPDEDAVGRTTEEVIEGLTKIVQEAVAPDSWREAGGSVGTIREFSGRLLIRQTRANHRRIEAVLDAMRATKTLPATRPATRPARVPAG